MGHKEAFVNISKEKEWDFCHNKQASLYQLQDK